MTKRGKNTLNSKTGHKNMSKKSAYAVSVNQHTSALKFVHRHSLMRPPNSVSA